MSKQLRVKVNGKAFDVEVGDFSDGSTDVTVNGKSYAIEIENEGGMVIAQPVVKSALAAVPVKTTAAVVPTSAVTIATGSVTDVVSAPMPGVIMDIVVKVGDKVAVGATVCALEAMKMKNLIRSTREGIVASVEVTEGQRVPFGAVIIRFV